VLVGLAVWAAASSLAPPVGANTAITPVLATVPGIVAADLVVGARSMRRWLTIGFLVGGLAVALVFLYLALLSLGGY
jgi:hypothetical protein